MRFKAARIILAIVGVLFAAWLFLPLALYPSKPLPDALQNELIHATNFEALALNHRSIQSLKSEGAEIGTNQLLDNVVLGGVQITNMSLQLKLVGAVFDDIKHAHHNEWECFDPRHGIRCQDGTNSIMMAICYHCGNVVVAWNGRMEYYLVKEDEQSPASRQIFEQIFHEAGVKEDEN